MFNIVAPGQHLIRVTWTGKSISINDRNDIGYKWVVSKGKKKKIPFIRKSDKYRDFCDSLTLIFQTQKTIPTVTDDVFMVYYVAAKLWGGKRKDADAFHKPLQDALEKSGIIANDSQIAGYCMIPMDDNPSMDVVVVDLFHMIDRKDIKYGYSKDRKDI